MMRTLIAALLALSIALPAWGQQFSLWADDGQNSDEFWTTSPYQEFTIYVFLEPGSEGARGAEYKMTVPGGHYMSESWPAPFVSAAIIGSPFGPPGVSAGFTSCLSGTAWIFYVTCVASTVDPGVYALEVHDYSNFRGIATCSEPDRPKQDAKAYNRFCYNTNGGEIVESSWGAIKNQF